MSSEDLLIYVLILSVAAVTYLSRLTGFLLGRGIHSKSSKHPIFEYANYITYALVAALVFKLIFLPIGALPEISVFWRGIATLGCLAAYLLHRKYLLPYLLTTVGFLTLIQFL